jgi:hypothetical protein
LLSSARPSPSQQQRSAPPAIAPLPKQATALRLSNLRPKLIQRFKTFNNKRNKSSYDVAGAVSDQELEAMVTLATELKDSTKQWLRNFHPELLKG